MLFGRYNTWYDLAGDLTYVVQAIVAFWGAYCMVMFLRRVRRLSFANERQQDEFLDEVEGHLRRNRLDEVEAMCDAEVRALPAPMSLGLRHRDQGTARVAKLIKTRLQRDVLADFDRLARWIGHCIKIAPMLGLFGTVLGMMGAFSQLATTETVQATELARNISLAPITTAIGLATAMPLMFALQKANERFIQFQDLMELGLARFLDFAQPQFESPASTAATISRSAPVPPPAPTRKVP